LPQLVTRFAPSPTGRLHLGHAFSAKLAHDYTRARGGQFLLRIEDIDEGRSRDEHRAAIFKDLAWLGLKWDGDPLLQSTRRNAYRGALERLRGLGVVYPCFCTRKDIADAGAAPHGPDGPLYPGTCRAIPGAERTARTAAEPHAWRLDVAAAAEAAGPLAFVDNGERIAADPGLLGDVVIARKDAGTSYHLAATLDDAHQGVTDIVRGVDLFPSTHVHRLLQALLGLPVPRYHHHALIVGDDGERLAKRNGARAVAEYRETGWSAADVHAELARLAAPLASGAGPR
jgi:glutamyl-Q tRNA(Asp) synthetase